MLTKFKNFCSKPITWGDYFKLCGGAFAITCAVYGASYVYLKYQEHKAYKDAQEIAARIRSVNEKTSQFTKESE